MTRGPGLGTRFAVRLGDLADLRGFTLPVVVVSIIVYGLVLLAGIGVVAEASLERRAVEGPGLRSLRTALTALEEELPHVRVPTPEGETTLVYADGDGIAFFRPVGTPGGVYATEASSLVTLWFEEDPDTELPNDYRLLRHVEGLGTTVVASRLLRDGETPFFEYLASSGSGGGPGGPAAVVPPHLLPLGAIPFDEEDHTVPLADGRRAVRVESQSAEGSRGGSPTSEETVADVTPPEARMGLGLRAVRVTLRAVDETHRDGEVSVRRLIALSSERVAGGGAAGSPR